MTTAPAAFSEHSPGGRPLWAASAPAAHDPSPLEGACEAEVVVIGAGFSGLSAALALAERRVSVVVLEAGLPGAGASGLSGGQVIPGLRHHLADLVAAYGETLGRRLHGFGIAAADALWDIVDRHAIACEADRGGWIQGAESAAALAEAPRISAAHVIDMLGSDYLAPDPRELHLQARTDEFRAAFLLSALALGNGSYQQASDVAGVHVSSLYRNERPLARGVAPHPPAQHGAEVR